MLTFCEIDLKAIKENLKAIKNVLNSQKILIVVKANAYGHGMIEVSKAVEKIVDFFGVVNLNEALKLREIGIKKPILVMGYTEPQEILKAVEKNISIVIISKDHLKSIRPFLKKLPSQKRLKVHLKIDTGISRLGVMPFEVKEVIKEIKKVPAIQLEGIMSHLASVEEKDIDYTKYQIKNFKSVINEIKKELKERPIFHLAASAAAIWLKETWFDMVRIGIAAYGLWPSEEIKHLWEKGEIKIKRLKPALSFKTKVVQIKRLKPPGFIGYGCSYKIKKPMKIAVIPVGYAEGFDRGFSNKGEVLVKGKRSKIVGRVCMNMSMIDISDINAKVGDEVVLIGSQGNDIITADELASKIDTINYEIVTRIPPDLMRIYKN